MNASTSSPIARRALVARLAARAATIATLVCSTLACSGTDDSPGAGGSSPGGASSANAGAPTVGGASGGIAGAPASGGAGAPSAGGSPAGGAGAGGVGAGGASGGAPSGAGAAGVSAGAGGVSAGAGGVSAGAGGNSVSGGAAGRPASGGLGGTSTAGAPATGGSAGASAGSAGAPLGGSSGTAFNPCPQTGPCKILPLGDSITDGFNTAGGYRIELFSKARGDGKSVTFVGGKMNGPMTVAGEPFPRNHEGYSGNTIAQMDGLVPNILPADTDIVLLHIGTNDMRNPGGAPERLEALVDQILTALPESLLVLSNIIPFPSAASAVQTYNATIPPIVQERASAGKHIIFVDQFGKFPASELPDTVHPSPAGYAVMAGVWYEAIKPYLR